MSDKEHELSVEIQAGNDSDVTETIPSSPVEKITTSENSQNICDKKEAEKDKEASELSNEVKSMFSNVDVCHSEKTKTEGKGFEVELDFESFDNLSPEKCLKKDIVRGEEVESDEEDGEILGEKSEKKKPQELEEGEDDGEILDDEEELEEGELKETPIATPSSVSKQPARPVCRFFNRGKCTFGNVCRFLHLNVNNERGNYQMFTERYTSFPPVHPSLMIPRAAPRQDFFPPPPVSHFNETSVIETAWVRGLSKAKELVKQAHIRKENSPDFKDKRLNLSLSEAVPLDKENDKENDNQKKRQREKQSDFYKYDDDYDFCEQPSRDWKNSYENFEIKYSNREESYRERDKGSRGSHMRKREYSPTLSKERFSRSSGRKWENDAYSRVRGAEEWFDPYRRSKSPQLPKGRRSRSRSLQPPRSYSTVSSYSYSNRSSVSYSRSSSGSSCDSSRSPSPMSKRKSPNEMVLSPKGQNRYLSKKKSGGRNSRSRSYSRSRSSRSHSLSRSSSSRSLSMDSITSSSSDSGSLKKAHFPLPLSKEEEVKPDEPANLTDRAASESFKIFQELQKLQKMKGAVDKGKSEFEPDDDVFSEILSTEEGNEMSSHVVPPFPSLQHLLPSGDKPKEPVAHKGLQKQQIKLTLLNKSQGIKIPSLPKEFDAGDESLNIKTFHPGIKRPHTISPPSSTMVPKSLPTLIPKRSAISRRDELLKQLKAVEDAIARKRAKFC